MAASRWLRVVVEALVEGVGRVFGGRRQRVPPPRERGGGGPSPAGPVEGPGPELADPRSERHPRRMMGGRH